MEPHVIKQVEDIATIQTRLDAGAIMFERINETLDRLSDIQASLKEVLVLHSERLRVIDIQFEQRLQNEATELGKVEKALADFIKAQTETNEKTDNRLAKIERWKWLVIGGAIAVGYLINYFDLLKPLVN